MGIRFAPPILISLLLITNPLLSKSVVLREGIPFDSQVKEANVTYIVKYSFDLHNRSFQLPKGVILAFEQGGVIYNGLISGDKMPTMAVYTPEMFGANQTDDDTDAIQSCLNVAQCVRMDYSYNVYTRKQDTRARALIVPSNTSIAINGIVYYRDSSYDNYAVISVCGVNNVVISGQGSICGDLLFHKGEKGEWGMGIDIVGSSDIQLTGLTIKDCWGDGVYQNVNIAKKLNSSRISISGLRIFNCRRNGISLGGGTDILIRDCHISDIFGTMPQACIDIERDFDEFELERVTVIGCICEDSYAGIHVSSPRHCKDVLLKNNIVKNKSPQKRGELMYSTVLDPNVKCVDSEYDRLYITRPGIYTGCTIGKIVFNCLAPNAVVRFDRCEITEISSGRDNNKGRAVFSNCDIIYNDERSVDHIAFNCIGGECAFYNCRFSLSGDLSYYRIKKFIMNKCSFISTSTMIRGSYRIEQSHITYLNQNKIDGVFVSEDGDSYIIDSKIVKRGSSSDYIVFKGKGISNKIYLENVVIEGENHNQLLTRKQDVIEKNVIYE